MSKNPEDMTMDEIKEQLAIYSRLYYNKRRNDEKYMQMKRASAQRHIQKKKIREYEEVNNIKLNPDELTEELLSEIMNAKKPFKAKRGTPKYDMSKFKIIKPMDDE